jgi:nucleoside phosphorylase
MGDECGFQVGQMLSGEKLVDDPEFKQALFDRYPKAIGREMEGAGVASAADRKKCKWIL